MKGTVKQDVLRGETTDFRFFVTDGDQKVERRDLWVRAGESGGRT